MHARDTGVTEGEARRMLNPDQDTKVGPSTRASRRLGRRTNVTMCEAACFTPSDLQHHRKVSLRKSG